MAGNASMAEGPSLRASAIVLTVVVPFGCGYYLSYLFRTVTAVISPQLVTELGLTPSDLGLLTSMFFITFAAMQIPLGILLDRYGPRRVQIALLLIAAAGAALFAVGDSFLWVAMGRGCIGIGVAGCLMASFKANAIWWPSDRLPLMNNVVAAFGSFGALSATVPVEWLLHFTGWREIFAVLALCTVGVSALMLFVVPERAQYTDSKIGLGRQIAEMLPILKDGYYWRVAALVVPIQASYLAYQTLWAGPWLRDVAGLGRAGVADHLFLMQLGMFVGVIGSGLLADRLRRLPGATSKILTISMASFIVVQAGLAFGIAEFSGALWLLFGLTGAGAFLAFALYTNYFPREQTGRVITAVNLILFVAAFGAQWGIGAVIGLYPEVGAGYSAEGHQAALIAMVVLQGLGFLWFMKPSAKDPTA